MPSSASPSEARRAAIKAQEAKKQKLYQSISNGLPIERYYDMASNLRDKFHKYIDKNDLDNAYIFGRRFATFSMEALPSHDYYRNKSREKLMIQNQKDLQRVLDALEQTVQLMDLEELERAEIKRREEEALRKIREREEVMREEERERAQTQDLLKRLNMLDSQFPETPSGFKPKSKATKKAEPKVQPSAPPDPPSAPYEDDVDQIPIGDLPAPIPFSLQNDDLPAAPLPPPPSYDQLPPSYDQLVRHRSEAVLQSGAQDYNNSSMRSLQPAHHYSNGGSAKLGDSIPLHHLDASAPPFESGTQDDATAQQPQISIAELKKQSKIEYDSLQQSKKIVVFYLSTYQGRIKSPGKDSTNGCAVISPLVVANHLASNGAGISDDTIDTIIDDIAPPLLSRVRRKLGLGGHALIIPSDVHDFLVDEKILKQDKFVGVCGGNLLDPDHVLNFLNMMEEGKEALPESTEEKKDLTNSTKSLSSNSNSNQKVAATLFFHEHVISIVKVVLSDGASWYDLVDSMPQYKKQNGKTTGMMGATRTRCRDRDSLQTVLLRMACSKFNATETEYIDNNDWDDIMCDLDPRVFQAFAWRE